MASQSHRNAEASQFVVKGNVINVPDTPISEAGNPAPRKRAATQASLSLAGRAKPRCESDSDLEVGTLPANPFGPICVICHRDKNEADCVNETKVLQFAKREDPDFLSCAQGTVELTLCYYCKVAHDNSVLDARGGRADPITVRGCAVKRSRHFALRSEFVNILKRVAEFREGKAEPRVLETPDS